MKTKTLSVVLTALCFLRPISAEDPRNILLICIDDLRPVMGAYGGQAITPHIDSFADTAVQFNRHYVQFPSCVPSRPSMFGGVRYDTISKTGGPRAILSKNQEDRPNLAMHLKNNGYTTLSFGKTTHVPAAGWSKRAWKPRSAWECYVDHQVVKKTDENSNPWRPAFEIFEGDHASHGDYQTADKAIQAIKAHRDTPFFIAAGFYKPHLPFVAPKDYWDLYDGKELTIPGPTEVPEGAALHQYTWSEIWTYGDQSGEMYSENHPPVGQEEEDLIRAYYASVSFIDAQVGRILEALEEAELADNTAVMIWSDHGFHLGDQTRWGKWTQFEADMRSPFMCRIPGVPNQGFATDALVESIDIYPTLSDFAGISIPDHLEGVSLLPIIRGETNGVKNASFSELYPLAGNPNNLRAITMRTDDYRYTEWRNTRSGKVTEVELYDMRNRSVEDKNLAPNPEYGPKLEKFAKQMRAEFGG